MPLVMGYWNSFDTIASLSENNGLRWPTTGPHLLAYSDLNMTTKGTFKRRGPPPSHFSLSNLTRTPFENLQLVNHTIMPTATKHIMDSPVKSPAQAGSSSKLRPITQAEIEAWTASLRRQMTSNFEFIDLDEPHEYPFQDQDPVWVRTKEDNWCYGRVTGRSIRVGHTRHSKQGFYYPVNFGSKNHLRKYFAPMNGEIKPDNEEVRLLLRDAGWLDDDDEVLTADSASSYTAD